MCTWLWDFKGRRIHQIKGCLNCTTNNVHFFQHCILFLPFHRRPLVIMSPNKIGWANFSPQSRFFRLQIILVSPFCKNQNKTTSYHHHHRISEKDWHQCWTQHFVYTLYILLYSFPLIDISLHVSLNLQLLKTYISLFWYWLHVPYRLRTKETKLCPAISTTESINALLTHAKVISHPRIFAHMSYFFYIVEWPMPQFKPT